MRRLAILGASGHGTVIADAAECSGWSEVVFFDDAWPSKTHNRQWRVIGNSTNLLSRHSQFDGVVVAIGNNHTRHQKQKELVKVAAKLATIQHPSAVVSRYATLGAGSVVFAGAIVNAGATIGNGVILNTGCTIDHGCIVGDFSHISPGAHLAGDVYIGTQSWVGIAACIRQQLRIGDNAVVGAGAVVICNVETESQVVGVPAKPQ